MIFRTILRKLHLILGLISGIVVVLISITGAMYAFKEEIESLYDGYKEVSILNEEIIPPSKAFEAGGKALPGKQIHGVIYHEKGIAIEIIYYQADPFFYGASYLNPYNGDIIKSVDFKKSFFGFALHGHMALWLPLEIGMPIVAIASLIFLIMLITGIILWWPRSFRLKKALKFTKKAGAKTKKLEYHKVVGFYVFFLALIVVLTGLSWLFKGIETAIYKSFGGQMETSYSMLPSDLSKADSVVFEGEAVDKLYEEITSQNPELAFLEIHKPADSSASVLVEINRDPSTYWKMDYIFYDQYTLEELTPDHIYGRYEVAGLPEKVRRLNYDIHTGNIWGFPGKLLAFIVSLFCASLPITGFLLWWHKRKEKQKLRSKLFE